MLKKILFIDRDGTLIDEPEDKQIDSLNKLKLKKNIIPALLTLQNAGFYLVMVSNQDGLGTDSFPHTDFEPPHAMLLHILESQGVFFSDILICPHFSDDYCDCRKPKLGLVMSYVRDRKMDCTRSYVIGDRATDVELAKNMGINSILFNDNMDWLDIARDLTSMPRRAEVSRCTKETNVKVTVDLDATQEIGITTGIGFFDHMLEQLAKHANFKLQVNVSGDLQVDEHHTVEDTAIALGDALRQALGDKLGINRYGFLLPMDEASTEVALDLSGRGYFVFAGEFAREKVGGLATELVPHFFRSFAENLGAALHIKVQGENSHHMIESIFKGVGRALRQAINQQGFELPSTKGLL